MRKLILVIILILSAMTAYADEGDDGLGAIEPDEIDIALNANPIPPAPFQILVQPGNPGIHNVSNDFAPQPSICDGAAGSYLNPGIEAAKTFMIGYDDIVYGNATPETVHIALSYFNAYSETSALTNFLFAELDSDAVISGIPQNSVVTVLDESTCLTDGHITARLWKVELDGIEGWAFESIYIPQVDLGDGFGQGQGGQNTINAQNFPVLVDGVTFRYLLPYVEPPLTSLGTANTIGVGASQYPTVCEHGAPSYLFVGAEVEFNGYGYERMPEALDVMWKNWTFYDTQYELSEYGFGRYIHLLNGTSLLADPTDFYSDLLTSAEIYGGVLRPTGEVVGGPVCWGANSAPSDGLEEWSEDNLPLVITWWQVQFEVNGQTHIGWYPESMAENAYWLWESDGIFPRQVVMYYLTPMMAMRANDSCYRVPESWFFAGQEIQPAGSALNLRRTPGGEVIGRIEAGQTVQLYGQSDCADGVRWWQANGGWIAERDPETQVGLLLPAVQAAPPAPTEPPIVVEPPILPPPIVTPAPTRPAEPTRPPCNPAPGAGC